MEDSNEARRNRMGKSGWGRGGGVGAEGEGKWGEESLRAYEAAEEAGRARARDASGVELELHQTA
eukprot:503020-Pleurochrysis_carterae.AAC.6